MVKRLIKISFLTFLLLLSVYFLIETIQNNYGESIELIKANYTPYINLSAYSYSEKELQFDKNMRFNHNNLSYKISRECTELQRKNMIKAFEFVGKEVKKLSFKEINNNESLKADILVLCGEKYLEEVKKENKYIAGEGGPVLIINDSLFNIILKGKIVLYKKSCSYNVELHELLHVLGFKHSENKKSIMYPISSCNQYVTRDIIEELNRLYSIKILPDLYFEKVNATKQGIYLDFKIIIRNQGLIDVRNATLRVYENNKSIGEFGLGKIEFGSGKILNVQNVRIKSRKTREIIFSVDPENKIKEYSKDNNKILLRIEEK